LLNESARLLRLAMPSLRPGTNERRRPGEVVGELFRLTRICTVGLVLGSVSGAGGLPSMSNPPSLCCCLCFS